ncbi:S8 family peptidase [Herbiconiux sp. VKM Ac-1786]|uniref:S8 family peptidase n=1 Tax=Herbiconiux sp. VKM Ac-1786 TaxID=2783824 RepID=UPI001889CAD0|nr:S8 family peptidase [Herbiconiux sp. VKM Ac-1786]MBF4573167.1 S8 family peptidase [Herbiconiux sp. VKM Ac-1786]
MADLPHIRISASRSDSYGSPRRGNTAPAPARDRLTHASYVGNLLEGLENEIHDRNLTGGLVLAFNGPGLEDEATRLGDKRTGNEVLAISPLETVLVGSRGDLSALQKKVFEYQTEETPKGRPKHEQLVARIETARIASVLDLSFGEIDDSEIDNGAVYFVELWLGFDTEANSDRARFAAFLESAEADQDLRHISTYKGTDRDVHLVAIRGSVLLGLPVRMPYLAEIHLPPMVRLREVAGQIELSKGLPPVLVPLQLTVAVAVHDTGLDHLHPLLAPVVLGTDSAVPNGSPLDWDGHGTRMAGLAVYGDLANQVLDSSLVPAAALIAVEYLEPGERGDVLWAERTQLSVEIAEDLGRDHRVVHSISMGAPNPREHEATSWSTAIDRAAWNNGEGRLIVVAAGNIPPAPSSSQYPSENLASTLSQPAQAWNAVTVGGVTELSTLSPRDVQLGASTPLAAPGQLSPFTSVGPARIWPSKPDVVAEAGNTAPDGSNPNPGLIGLSVLTTAARTIGSDLTRANATSAATAITANALARIWATYPDFRPATIRGLLIHSSRPTPSVVSQLDPADLRRSIGHGSFNWSRAALSSESRPVMVYEGSLQPKIINFDKSVTRQVVLVQLPFPASVLRDLGSEPAELQVTLSYFVEPSESERRSKYAGVRLRWDMQGPNETPEEFAARINALAREEDHVTHTSSYNWNLGADGRSRSSVQHDWMEGPAESFAGDRLIAVYPVLGWWDRRKGFEQRTVDFSLVASLEIFSDVDIYAPISAALDIDLDVEIDAEIEIETV